MNTQLWRLHLIAIAATVTFAPLQHSKALLAQTVATSPCAADSNFQRLAFWVGDWEVLDSAGKHYANQRVRAAVDKCAITAEWSGRVGDKGLNVSAYDLSSRDWKQVYVGNQVPSPLGVEIRKSDPSYGGPGIRFISLLDAPAGNLRRSRITIMPVSSDRVQQLFETSSDGGTTWRTLFKADFRRLADS